MYIPDDDKPSKCSGQRIKFCNEFLTHEESGELPKLRLLLLVGTNFSVLVVGCIGRY